MLIVKSFSASAPIKNIGDLAQIASDQMQAWIECEEASASIKLVSMSTQFIGEPCRTFIIIAVFDADVDE